MRASPDIYGQVLIRRMFTAVLVLAVLLNAAVPAFADQTSGQGSGKAAQRKPQGGRKSADPAPTRRPAPAMQTDERPAVEVTFEPLLTSSALRPYLTGDEWQDTALRFEQWLNVQTLYDSDQVARDAKEVR